MKVVITGAGGFVGRRLAAQLLGQGHDVVALDSHLPTFPPGVRGIAGDLAAASVRAAALAGGRDALVHLATVPGGAAEADPAASRRINVDAMYDLMLELAAVSPGARFVYASSIAVFGDPLPAMVDDATVLAPKMIYGGHKAMMEDAVALFSHRGLLDGVTLRLPGILARPKAASGMKSAFMSELFHALRAGAAFTCPVSAQGTIWAQSLARCAANFAAALTIDSRVLPPTRAVTLPALRITLRDLADEVARQCGVSPGLVTHAPDPALEAGFATQPPLATPAAERAGFAHDGDVATLVTSALATLQ
ncbi:MAG: NAD-dependent epimerase/dehydratase family protein [Sphingomonadales bacterium]|nr:NAD-dependent epimerase/dehydratase family protein [Sphingomonadales bacterium]